VRRLNHLAITIVLARNAVGDRLRQRLAAAGRDRGEGPVSTAIMVALIAGAALAVATLIATIANRYASQIPKGD
jgi:hypothetical protein